MGPQIELDVNSYAASERRAMAGLSNDHIRAFSPATFAFHGYPAAAESDAAVARFVDTMQELNRPHWYHQTELYSREEADLITRVNSAVLAETQRAFGRAIRPWMGPLVATKPFRAIQAVAAAAGRERLRIFEIGPGSGYLGALLIAQGHEYYSTDIAQGFYLWQSRLMQALAGEDFVEGVRYERWPYEAAGRAVHMPWWQYATLYRDAPPSVDIVICDHALGEMNPYALRYVAQMSKNMLSESPLGLVMFTSIGEPRFNSEEAVRLNFNRVGLDCVVNRNVAVLAMTGRPLHRGIAALADSIPRYNPSGTPERLRGRDFVPINRDEAPVSFEFYGFLGYDVPESAEDTGTPKVSGRGRTEDGELPGSAKMQRLAVEDVLRSPSTATRLRGVIGKTRQHGLGWLARRVVVSALAHLPDETATR